MEARFGAKIVRFGVVGEDELGLNLMKLIFIYQVILDYTNLTKIRSFRAAIEGITAEAVEVRSDVSAEAANQEVSPPVV